MRTSQSSFVCIAALLVFSGCTVTTATTGTDQTDAGNGGTSNTDAAAGGGAGGDGSTTSGGDGGTVTPPGQTVGAGCSDAPANNHTRETATPYTLGTAVKACLRNSDDINFYQFTAPAAPAKGGYVIVHVTDVDPNGNVDATSQAAADNGDIAESYTSDPGASVYMWFPVKAGATFRVRVKHFSSNTDLTAYTLNVAYSGSPDTRPVNDLRTSAAPLAAGATTQGYFLAGYEVSSAPIDAAWDSWYKVTLTAGTGRAELTNVPADSNTSVSMYDALGKQLDVRYSATPGEGQVLEVPIPTAGDYYVNARPFTPPTLNGTTSNVPQWLTQPYSLKVFNK